MTQLVLSEDSRYTLVLLVESAKIRGKAEEKQSKSESEKQRKSESEKQRKSESENQSKSESAKTE